MKLIAQFIEDNPQLRLTEFPEGEYYKMAEPLDFTHEMPTPCCRPDVHRGISCQ